MSLSPGTRLGPYEIIAPIGAGGMGEVYRAKDTRLGRDVALKTLPSALTKDEEQRARFEREARAASSLNHPHICVIHDVGSDNGVEYLVMELLEGETAADCLARGPMPVADVMRLGAQIADALDRAHKKGLVHRDLKPANIMLVRPGSKSGPMQAKLLDFGLARPTSATATDATMTKALTAAGTIVGTFQYMSPEQIEGREVDGRTDIWSLGATLYEMATGVRAFDGASTASVISAVMRDEPKPIAERVPLTPPGFQRIVSECLAKDPDDRWQSAGDVKRELDWIGSGGGSGSGMAATAPVSARRSRTLWMAAALVVVSGLSAAAAWWAHGSRPSLPTLQRITFRHGAIDAARFEPGADNVVYSARWQGAQPLLFSVHPESPESRTIGTAEANLLALSPKQDAAVMLAPRLSTGRYAGTLATVPLGGGGVRELATRVIAADYTSGGGLAALESTGDEYLLHLPVGHVIYRTSALQWLVRCAPRGGLIAIYGSDGLKILDESGAVKTTIEERGISGIAWSPNGSEVWYSKSDAPGQSTIGAATLGGATRDLWRGPSLTLQDISAKGVLLVLAGDYRAGVFVERAGSPAVTDFGWLDGSSAGAVSPSGDALLVSELGDAGGGFYVRKLEGSPAIRLGDGRALAWSPKGDMVLARGRGDNELLLTPVGLGASRSINPAKLHAEFGWFHPDGRLLVNGRDLSAGPAFRFFWVDEKGTYTPARSEALDHWINQNVLSPDGKLIAAYPSGSTGKGGVSVYPLDGGPALPIAGFNATEVIIQFSADSRHLLVYDRDRLPVRIFELDYRTGQRTLWREFAPSDAAGIAGIASVVMTTDGRVVAYNYQRALNTAYLISGLK